MQKEQISMGAKFGGRFEGGRGGLRILWQQYSHYPNFLQLCQNTIGIYCIAKTVCIHNVLFSNLTIMKWIHWIQCSKHLNPNLISEMQDIGIGDRLCPGVFHSYPSAGPRILMRCRSRVQSRCWSGIRRRKREKEGEAHGKGPLAAE